MSSIILSLCISGSALAAEPESTEKSDQIGVSVGQLSQVLEERGYQHVRSTGDSRDIYKFEACKDGQRLQLDLDKQGEIQKQESLGLCVVAEGKTPAKTALKGGKSSVSREKPIKIEAPYTSVEIGDSVRIRAPFVNLDIPIR